MPIPASIVDHSGDNHLHINGEGEASVVVHTHPPIDETVESLPFRQYFTDNGLSTGSNDIRVNGSATNVNFYIKASSSVDIYIKTISVQISDTGAKLNLFGALSALTNGVEFKHITQDHGDTILHDSIKDNLTFVRLGLNSPQIGAGTTAFRADISGSGADTYLPIMNMTEIFGLPWGLRLRKGTNDELAFVIKDNLSVGLDQFDVIGYGIKL